jgi:DNA-binding protein HU-beta
MHESPIFQAFEAAKELTRRSGSDICCRNRRSTVTVWWRPRRLQTMAMTQAQFFTAVAEKAGVSKKQVKDVFSATEDVILRQLKNMFKIPLGGLGAIKLVDRKARMGRNPATGEPIKIPAKRAVKLTPAKSLKEAFNKKAK